MPQLPAKPAFAVDRALMHTHRGCTGLQIDRVRQAANDYYLEDRYPLQLQKEIVLRKERVALDVLT